jgi:dTDP-4-amino-4,6-dideoxygalactose transaminase
MIKLSEPYVHKNDLKFIKKIFLSKKFTDGYYQNKTEKLIKSLIKAKFVALTQSCTDALEAACLLINFKVNDEVLIPSYTFTSTANPFVMRGAKPVFVDIQRNNLCMDLNDLEKKYPRRQKQSALFTMEGNLAIWIG